MTDIFIFTDTNIFPDRFMQPDSTALYGQDSLTQTLTDKKENNICLRFAFLKISKKICSTFACASARADAYAGKRAAILFTCIIILFISYWNNLKIH